MNTKVMVLVFICFFCPNICNGQTVDSVFVKSLIDKPITDVVDLNKQSIKKIYNQYYMKETVENSLFFKNIALLYQNNSAIKKIKYFPHLLIERLVHKKKVTGNNLKDDVRSVLEILNSKKLMRKTKKMVNRLCTNDDFLKSELLLVVSKINSCKCLNKIKQKKTKVSPGNVFSIADVRYLAILSKFEDSESLNELDKMIANFQQVNDHASVIKIVEQLTSIGGRASGELIIDRVLMSDYKLSSYDHEQSDFLLAFSALSELILDWQDKDIVNSFFTDADDELIKKRVRDWILKNRTQIRFKP